MAIKHLDLSPWIIAQFTGIGLQKDDNVVCSLQLRFSTNWSVG